MTGRGSTRPWRRVRVEILERDGYRCQMPRNGRPCGLFAAQVDHIVPVALGGAELDPANLRAACVRCNTSAGALLGNRLKTLKAARDRWAAPIMRKW